MDAYEGVSVEDEGAVATTYEIRGDLKATFGLVVFLSGPDLLTNVSNKVSKSYLGLTLVYLRNRASLFGSSIMFASLISSIDL